MATQQENVEVVRLLVGGGADVDICENVSTCVSLISPLTIVLKKLIKLSQTSGSMVISCGYTCTCQAMTVTLEYGLTGNNTCLNYVTQSYRAKCTNNLAYCSN